jgi:hypothetical protein
LARPSLRKSEQGNPPTCHSSQRRKYPSRLRSFALAIWRHNGTSRFRQRNTDPDSNRGKGRSGSNSGDFGNEGEQLKIVGWMDGVKSKQSEHSITPAHIVGTIAMRYDRKIEYLLRPLSKNQGECWDSFNSSQPTSRARLDLSRGPGALPPPVRQFSNYLIELTI